MNRFTNLAGTRRNRLRATTGALLAAATMLSLAACGSSPDSADAEEAAEGKTSFIIAAGADNPLEGGVVSFIADEVAADYGITIETKELQDSRVMNESLVAGEIDGNVAVHAPFLDIILDGEPSWDLVAATPIYISLGTLASAKHDSLDDLPQGGQVAIPDDPVNGALALNVLQEAGIIELDPDVEPAAYTVDDIIVNEKELTWVPAGASTLARSVEDTDLAFLPTSFLRASGYDSSVELRTEPFPAEYAIQLVIRGADADTEAYAKLIEAFQDPRVADFVDENYGDIAFGIRN